MDDDPLEKLIDWVRNRHFGKYRGTVRTTPTPPIARLKVRVPGALGDLQLWAMPCVPYAGDNVGFYFLPEPGTGVWVEFEAGDIRPDLERMLLGRRPAPRRRDRRGHQVMRTAKTTVVFDDDAPELRATSSTPAT